MKFSDLKIGQKFLYKGMELEKCGPFQAIENATGTEKMIMRAAAIELLNTQFTDESKKPASLNELKQALATYHQTCLTLLQTQSEQLRETKIEAAYREIQQVVERLSQVMKQGTSD